MGHNRSGDKRRARLKRRYREEVRLAAKASAQAEGGATAKTGGLTSKVKKAAKGVVEKVGDLMKAAGEKIKGTSK
jgi:hypothetical protein